MTPTIRAIATCLLLASAGTATAQPILVQPSNQLGDCFVLKTTGQDRMSVARWVVAAFGSAPQVADLANVSPAMKEELDRQMAQIFTRLLSKDCAEVAKPLMQQRDSRALQLAGGALGQIAVQELMGNPQAAAALSEFTKYLDPADFADLRK